MKVRIVILSLTLLVLSRTAWAIFGVGDIVNDPINLIQNTLTAARTLISNANEATQIENQLNEYVQQAKHLVALPMSVIDDISSLYQQYNNLLNQGLGISYAATDAVKQFEALYDTGMNGNVPLMQKAQQMIGQVRAASRDLTAVSAIYSRLCADQSHVQTLITASQAAPGSLAAQQATNQLMGVLANQQASLQEITATTGRVQTGFIMRQVTAEEQAQWNAQHYLQMPTPAAWDSRPSQGITLPQQPFTITVP